jgi:hypothetical protein
MKENEDMPNSPHSHKMGCNNEITDELRICPYNDVILGEIYYTIQTTNKTRSLLIAN